MRNRHNITFPFIWSMKIAYSYEVSKQIRQIIRTLWRITWVKRKLCERRYVVDMSIERATIVAGENRYERKNVWARQHEPKWVYCCFNWESENPPPKERWKRNWLETDGMCALGTAHAWPKRMVTLPNECGWQWREQRTHGERENWESERIYRLNEWNQSACHVWLSRSSAHCWIALRVDCLWGPHS